MTAATGLPRLIAITDTNLLPPPALLSRLRHLAEAARPGGVAVLLRDHTLEARRRLELGRDLRAMTRDTGQFLWVADRLDLALLLKADGLHLGEASVPASVARRLWRAPALLTRAWHTTSAHPSSELQGVNAVLVSPVLAERKGRPPLGLAAVESLQRSLSALGGPPVVYALGGVDAAHARACLRAGAAGVAAIGAALGPDATALVDALEIARGASSG